MAVSRPFPFRVEIAPAADLDANSSEYVYVDVTGRRRQAADIEIDYGRDDEQADVQPGSGALTFDDRDGDMSPRNPYGTWAGDLANGTPIRFRLPVTSDDFTRADMTGGWGSTADGEAWVPPGGTSPWSIASNVGRVSLPTANTATWNVLDVGASDLDVTYSVAIDAVTTGAIWTSAAALRYVSVDEAVLIYTDFMTDGTIRLRAVEALDGFQTRDTASPGVNYSAGVPVWVRAQADGSQLRGKAWAGTVDDEPDGWHVTYDGAQIFGTGFAFLQWRVTGNTNPGALAVSVDTVNVDALVYAGNVPDWPPRWDKSGNDSTTPVSVAGVMRRLSQSDDLIRSPIYRQLTRYDPSGYWDLESSGSPAVSQGRAATLKNVSFVDDESLPGSAGYAKLDEEDSYAIGYATGDSGDEWAAMIFLRLETDPPADTNLVEWRSEGSLLRWVVISDGASLRLKGFAPNGDELFDSGPSLIVVDPMQWWAVQLETVQDGSDIDYTLLWHQVGDDVFYAINGSVAGTTRRVYSTRVVSSANLVGLSFAHAWLGAETLPFVNSTFQKVAFGYSGELAADRIGRLCAEEGVPALVGPGLSEPLGAQRPGAFMDLLREAADADMGVLHERGQGLAYIPHGDRFNAPVVLELDWAAGDLGEAPEPTDDDQRLRNQWTVKRVGGGERTYTNEASRLKHGLRKDADEFNLEADVQLADQASWRTHLGTWDDMRWPRVYLNLAATPHLIPDWLRCGIGSRIQIVNPKEQVAGAVIDLFIEGIQQTFGLHRWDVTLACSPARPWDVAVYDDEVRRKDSRTTQLLLPVDADDTEWVIATADPDEAWSVDWTPYDWELDGERVTVDSITAPSPSVASTAGTFDTTDEGWTAFDATWTRSSTQSHSGGWAGRLQVVGSPAQAYSRAPGVAAREGMTYRLTAWVRVGNIRTISASIDWLDEAFGWISTTEDPTVVAAGTWTELTVEGEAPAGAAWAIYGTTLQGSPPDASVMYTDDVTFEVAGHVVQTATVTRAVNDVAVPHPAGTEIHMHRDQLARYAF